MFLLLLFFSLFFSSAQECSCPVVQCDPCQKAIVLATQKIQCTPEKSMMCKNIVCENVDNYFQCIAGAYPQFVPAEDVLSRLTDPDIFNGPVIISPENLKADFNHYKHEIQIEDIKTSTAPAESVVSRSLSSVTNPRVPSVKPKKVPKEALLPMVAPLILRGALQVSIHQAPVQKIKVLTVREQEVSVRFHKAQSFWMDYSGASAHWKVKAGTEIRFVKEGPYLSVHPIQGDVNVESIDAKDVLIFDAGLWRIGKSKGKLSFSVKGEDLILKNQKGQALLRKDQLIAKSEPIDEGVELVVSHDFGIVHSDQFNEESSPQKWRMNEDLPKSRRVLASASIDVDGCSHPRGEIQQCAWKCFGAKNKSRSCENSQTTQCVRFTCSLGGEWKLPTRVSGKECKSDTVVVENCQ